MAFGFGRQTVASAQVEITVNDSQANEGLRRVETQSRRTFGSVEKDVSRAERGIASGSGAFSHLGRSVAFASGAFLGAAGFTSVVKSSISQAEELRGEMLKATVIFGDSAKGVQEWAKTNAQAFGLTQAEALASQNQLGAMFEAMGSGRKEAAKLATETTELSAKMALFAHTDAASASQAIAQAYAGRTRALRQYGIIIDQTTIKAEAQRMGLLKGAVDTRKVTEDQTKLNIAAAKAADAQRKYGTSSTQAASAALALAHAHDQLKKDLAGTTGVLSQHDKILATHNLIVQQTTNINRNWNAQQGTLSQQMRVLHAATGDLEEELGTALLPTITKVAQKVTVWIKSISDGGSQHEKFISIIKRVKDAITETIRVVQTIVKAIGGWKTALSFILSGYLALKFFEMAKAVRAAFAIMSSTNPILLALTGLAFITVEIITHWNKVKAWFDTFWTWTKRLFNAGSEALKQTFRAMVYGILQYATAALRGILELASHLPFVGKKAKAALDSINDYVNKWKPDFAKVAAAAGSDAGSAMGNAMVAAFTPSLGQIQSGISGAGTPVTAGQNPRTGAQQGSSGVVGGIIATAKTQLGMPYQYGGSAQLGVATDCSGLMVAVFASHGISLPRTADQQYAQAPIKPFSPLPGDLVFYDSPHIGHVALYLGNNLVLEDPHTGGHVQVVSMFYPGKPVGYGRWWDTGKKTPRQAPTQTNAGGGGTTPPVTVPSVPTATPLHVGTSPTKPKTPKVPNLADIPGRFSQAISQAERTRSLADDRKAYSDEVAWLKGQLQNVKITDKERTQLEHELSSATKHLQDINKKIQADLAAKERARRIPKTSTEKGLGGLISGAATALGESNRFQNIGQETFDPKLGRITVNLQPDFKTVQKNRNALIKKYAALKATLKSLSNQLSKELRKPKRLQHPAYIARVRKEIQKTQAEMTDVAQAIDLDSSVLADIAQAAADKETADAQEADTIAQQAADAAAQAQQDAQQAYQDHQTQLTTLPADIRLAEVQAQGTADTGDDATALNRALNYYQTSLGQTSDIETQITLVDAINGVKSQIAQLLDATTTQTTVIASGSDQVAALLSAQMSIRSQYAGNIFSPMFNSSRLSGVSNLPSDVANAVTIIQNFTSQPEDPFVWLRKSQFAASAVFG